MCLFSIIYRNVFLFRHMNPLKSYFLNYTSDCLVPPPALDNILSSLNHTYNGTSVYWGPVGCGKTETLKMLQKRLTDERRHVVIIDGRTFFRNIEQWFEHSLLGITSNSVMHLDPLQFIPRSSISSTVIIIDHFDNIINIEDVNRVRGFIDYYVEKSMCNNSFKLLLCMNSVDHARDILSCNHRILLATPPESGYWQPAHVQLLITKLIDYHGSGNMSAEQLQETLLQLKLPTPDLVTMCFDKLIRSDSIEQTIERCAVLVERASECADKDYACGTLSRYRM